MAESSISPSLIHPFHDYSSSGGKQRWISVGCLCLGILCNNMEICFFNSIREQFLLATEYSALQERLFYMIPMFCFCPSNILAMNLIQRKSLKYSFILGCILIICSLWLRLLIMVSPAMLFVSFALGYLGQSLILNGPTRLAADWFSSQGERQHATAIMCGMFSLGTALGMFAPFSFVQMPPLGQASAHDLREGIFKASILQAAIITPLLIFCSLLLKEKPAVPISRSANAERLAVRKGMMRIVWNRNTMFLLMGMLLLAGLLESSYEIIRSLRSTLRPDISQVQERRMGGIAGTNAMIGCILICWHLSKESHYRIAGVILLPAAAISGLLWIGSFYFQIIPLSFVSLSFVGWSAGGFRAITMELAAQVGFPAREEVAATFVNACIHFMSSLIIFALSFADTERVASILFGLLAVLVIGECSLFLKSKIKFRRSEYEISHPIEDEEYKKRSTESDTEEDLIA